MGRKEGRLGCSFLLFRMGRASQGQYLNVPGQLSLPSCFGWHDLFQRAVKMARGLDDYDGGG